MKIAINTEYGTFSLSDVAMQEIIKRKGVAFIYGEDFHPGFDKYRTDTDLIAVIEELGWQAWGFGAHIEIVEIPDGIEYEIFERSGSELVMEIGHFWGGK